MKTKQTTWIAIAVSNMLHVRVNCRTYDNQVPFWHAAQADVIAYVTVEHWQGLTVLPSGPLYVKPEGRGCMFHSSLPTSVPGRSVSTL